MSAVVGAYAAGGNGSIGIAPGTATVTGDFAGTDARASSSLCAESIQTVARLEAKASGTGIKQIDLGTGATHATGNVLTLG